MKSDFEKPGELIEDEQIAMVTTVESGGTLHMQPLATVDMRPAAICGSSPQSIPPSG